MEVPGVEFGSATFCGNGNFRGKTLFSEEKLDAARQSPSAGSGTEVHGNILFFGTKSVQFFVRRESPNRSRSRPLSFGPHDHDLMNHMPAHCGSVPDRLRSPVTLVAASSLPLAVDFDSVVRRAGLVSTAGSRIEPKPGHTLFRVPVSAEGAALDAGKFLDPYFPRAPIKTRGPGNRIAQKNPDQFF